MPWLTKSCILALSLVARIVTTPNPLGLSMKNCVVAPLIAFSFATLATAVDAQTDPASPSQSPSESLAATDGTAAFPQEKHNPKQSPAAADSSRNEGDAEDQRFIGLRGRIAYIPSWMFDLFGADGGKGVVSPSVGPEYVTRKHGFETDIWLVFISYGMGDVPFKAKSDPDTSYEIVRSHIKTLTIGADFLWSKPLGDPRFTLTYGAGAGIGVVFGDLIRNQAYPPDGQPGDPTTYVKCPGPGRAHGDYCDASNDHYNDYQEPNWLHGGAKPILFPWITLPQVGVLWNASRDFVLRLDTGLSFPGPWFFGL